VEKIGYSAEEASSILGVGRTTVFGLVASGELESVKVGRRRIIPADALQRFLDGLRADARESQPA
jgi:excisionase family DNA binding protein